MWLKNVSPWLKNVLLALHPMKHKSMKEIPVHLVGRKREYKKEGGAPEKVPPGKYVSKNCKKTYIDKSVAADIQGAFETQERQTAGGKGRSNIEDGFRGSALISAPRPAAPTVVAIDAPVEVVAVYS